MDAHKTPDLGSLSQTTHQQDAPEPGPLDPHPLPLVRLPSTEQDPDDQDATQTRPLISRSLSYPNLAGPFLQEKSNGYDGDDDRDRGFFGSPSSELQTSKRIVNLTKKPRQPFGAQFWLVHRRVYVVFVSEYVPGTTPEQGIYSAAFRAGLSFGDEIKSVNGEQAASQSLLKLVDKLTAAEHIKIELSQHSLQRQLTVFPPSTCANDVGSSRRLGMTYSDARIIKLVPDSLAKWAGLEVGETIVDVGGRCMVGKEDEEVCQALVSEFKKNRPFHVVVMRHTGYIELLKGIQAAIQFLPDYKRLTIASIIESDFELKKALSSLPSLNKALRETSQPPQKMQCLSPSLPTEDRRSPVTSIVNALRRASSTLLSPPQPMTEAQGDDNAPEHSKRRQSLFEKLRTSVSPTMVGAVGGGETGATPDKTMNMGRDGKDKTNLAGRLAQEHDLGYTVSIDAINHQTRFSL